jgi:hypothetical protein
MQCIQARGYIGVMNWKVAGSMGERGLARRAAHLNSKTVPNHSLTFTSTEDPQNMGWVSCLYAGTPHNGPVLRQAYMRWVKS